MKDKMKDKVKITPIPGFDIDQARTFIDIHTVNRETTVLGMNSNKSVTEQLVPIRTINFIIDQLEHNYVPEKFI